MLEWTALPISFTAMLAALLIHARVRQIFPRDLPSTPRKLHSLPTPLAGIVPAIGTCAYLTWIGHPYLGAAAALASVLGFLDDLAKQNNAGGPSWKFKAITLLIASLILALGRQQATETAALDLILVTILIFVITNAVNFLDNTNGVALTIACLGLLLSTGGQGPLAAVGYLWLGALPFNWPRSHIFIGDAGALCLGLCLSAATLDGFHGPQGFDSLAAVAIAGIPLADFAQVVTVRIAIGHPPWVGDQRHLTHIAMNLGSPRWAVAPLFGAMAAGIYWALG